MAVYGGIMTTYNFTHKKGDTFNGVEFILSSVLAYPTLTDFPAIGVAGIIYKAVDTALLYKYALGVYGLTTDIDYIDLTDTTILCQFKKSPSTESFLTLTTGSGLTITDATGGKFRIDNQIIDIPADTYQYDIQVKFLNGA